MKYAIYEDPLTHKFALLALPSQFVDGDTPPIIDVDRWFSSREEVVAALPDLLNREEPDSRGVDAAKRTLGCQSAGAPNPVRCSRLQPRIMTHRRIATVTFEPER